MIADFGDRMRRPISVNALFRKALVDFGCVKPPGEGWQRSHCASGALSLDFGVR